MNALPKDVEICSARRRSRVRTRRAPCGRDRERIRKLNSTGTSVNDSARLAISETQTESDSGENRYLAVPCSRNTGTKTMQMRDRRKHGRHADFAGPVDDGVCQRVRRMHMALDVLDDHRAVVDEDADGQREAAERHRVQGLAADVHHQHGGDDRQRNGRENDQRQPPVAEKQQDHHRRQTRPPSAPPISTLLSAALTKTD